MSHWDDPRSEIRIAFVEGGGQAEARSTDIPQRSRGVSGLDRRGESELDHPSCVRNCELALIIAQAGRTKRAPVAERSIWQQAKLEKTIKLLLAIKIDKVLVDNVRSLVWAQTFEIERDQ